jgi:predicted phage terminase large subunit-like protein
MQELPCDSPQIGYDTVSVVRRIRGSSELVYDVQVESNCNLFTGEILSHNCLIIDDPTKGRAEADSEAYQENSWEWWTETARTRLAPHAPVIVVQTRWHQLDLAGRLIEQDHNWRNINIPAQCEDDNDPLGREIGEYLISARGRTPEEWQQIQREVGDRAWSALYQGRPAPAEGGMFKRSWWQYDETPVCYRKSDGTMHAQGMDVVIQSWDMTFKNTDGTDFVVGQVWGRAGATAHLLDQVRARMDFPQTCVAVEELSRKWPQATLKLIEDKANGPAVISQLRKTVPGMVPVNPEGNKQARANAVTPYVEAGNVCLPLPARAPWINGYLEEHAAFPTGSHDDQVDATTQALARLMLMPSSTTFLEELVNQR